MAAGAVRRLGTFCLDLLLPPCCVACGEPVGAHGSVCSRCWAGLDFLAEPCCARCGHPFEHDSGPDSLCGLCLRAPPVYGRARAALRYDDGSRPLVLGFKHRDRTELAPALARWMAGGPGGALLNEADLLVPVPLHWTRLFARRFNQSAVLARALGRQSSIEVLPDLLVRTRRTPSQGRLGRDERRRNVRRAFALHPRHAARAEGRRVLLVDDVLTTGATVEACTAVLLAGGAASVDVLTLARVVRATP